MRPYARNRTEKPNRISPRAVIINSMPLVHSSPTVSEARSDSDIHRRLDKT